MTTKVSTKLTAERFREIKQRNEEFVEAHLHRIQKGEFLRVASVVFTEIGDLCAEVERLNREVTKLRGVIGVDEDSLEPATA